ncbi:MAG: DoxX family protein [Bryobacteraceae bacterium]
MPSFRDDKLLHPDLTEHKMIWPKRVLLVLASVTFLFSGILHFTKTSLYLKIMPPYIPWHLGMVQISGACEIVGALGLLLPSTRRLAAWGLVALLIAVFPANLYMAANPVKTGVAGIPAVIRWGRLPLQLVLISWVLWCSKADHQNANG